MSQLRRHRQAAGLSQVELARRAGLSRQLVGAAEAGRHLPRVDAALALSRVLGVEVNTLFGRPPRVVDVVSGNAPAERELVRVGQVGEHVVTAPVRVGPDGWDVADAMVEGGSLNRYHYARPGLVVAGCEPGLEALERMLRERGMGAVAVTASSVAAIDALAGGRVHAAVVHGPAVEEGLPQLEIPVERFRLTRWRVGLATTGDATPGWWREALSGTVPVIQRERGAGVQRAFLAAVGHDRPVAGPRVGGHLESARRAVLTGMAGVTIEPAARAVGAAFHPLEAHDAELWVGQRWMTDRLVDEALSTIGEPRFQMRLRSVGGYDLTGSGSQVG